MPRASALVSPSTPDRTEEQQTLARRLGALGELLGLSRGRVDPELLAEAARVSEEAGARRRLPDAYSVVALAGATGSGKSSLFNTLAGAQLSEVGICRPTTAAPVSCTWEAAQGEGGADGLLDRLSIAPSARRYSWDENLNGLVLIDLPDHDSVAPDHRPQVDRLLGLVDAVVWVVDPEKYADALLHERYLRRMPHHADVTFVVLNQIDRLGREAVGAVLDDLRRLLDSDGVALGDYGEPGAAVLATSAHTGEGIGELRTELASLAAARRAAALRIGADLDSVLRRLRPLYVNVEAGELGLTELVRERFDERLAVALGARAAGEAAERAWLRGAEEASATVWARLLKRRIEKRRTEVVGNVERGLPAERPGGALSPASRPAVAQAVRELGESAAAGLPEAWSRRVRDAAFRGAAGLPEALDEAARRRYGPGEAEDAADFSAEGLPAELHASSSYAPEARDAVGTAQNGGAVEERADAPLHNGAEKKKRGTARFRSRSRAGGASLHEPGPGRPRWRKKSDAAVSVPRPAWAPVALVGQVLMMLLQLVGAVWMLVASTALGGETAPLGATLLGAGAVGAPLLSWTCRRVSQGPARVHGSTEEARLRRLAAGCGRSRVLEPVAAELVRYREAREQYVVATGEV
ncbi:GTPase [Streptomyces sulphureus]|uniref:GTPase n=1 Tax=Streptomyces sulphureus TaxID=47758 RepID=UPI00316ACB1A